MKARLVNSVVDRDIDALVAEVVGDGQALEPPTAGQRIADEIHAPHAVGRARG